MKKSLIKKKLSFTPNLQNYEQTYRKFSWQDIEKELTYFKPGYLNAAYNAIDVPAQDARKNKVALYWEGADGKVKKYTFAEISSLSNKFANVLKKLKVEKGQRVFIFLPRVPELYISFLGILKTGAIAGTLFAAFGYQALKDRLENSDACILITNKELKERVNKIKKNLPALKKIIVIDQDSAKQNSSIISFWQEMKKADDEFKVSQTKAEDPAFMLYTSGTTGKPKGVVHHHKAILHEYMTAKHVLDIKPEDVYWCTADPGWVTGIAYEILGTWANAASTLVYEGRFSPDTWYSLIEKYRVNVWYTAPTAIRMLAAVGLKKVKKYDLSSLRFLASVGEPLNPEAVFWGQKAFGLPFHDNFWQTETGGIVIANYPSMPIKPGSMGKPVPGIVAGIVDNKGKELKPGKEGNLALRPGWPSMMAKIWRRPKKYKSYFIGSPKKKDSWYITGDKAYKDKDGYFWFVGRADDVIKTAGERVGPFEVESALVEHPAVVEAGVIGKPDPMRGEIIKAFVVLAQAEKIKKVL